ncbi:MAG TPA: flagellar basal body-associated protein FliL [Afipia sp.]
MAEDDRTEDGAEGAAPKGKRKLIMMVGAAVLTLIVGGGSWFMFFRGHGEEKPVEVAAKPPVFMDVPELLVNLATSPGERTQYLKVKVVLEVKDAPVVAQIQPTMPRVTDLFQTYLRELRPGDLNGSVGLFRLKEELTRRVNVAVAPGQVSAVLFKEIVIQ